MRIESDHRRVDEWTKLFRVLAFVMATSMVGCGPGVSADAPQPDGGAMVSGWACVSGSARPPRVTRRGPAQDPR